MTANKSASAQFLSFDEWLKDNEAYVEQHFQDMYNQIECDQCAGTGIMEIEGKEDYEFRKHMREIFEEQKRLDAKKLEDWNRIVREAVT